VDFKEVEVEIADRIDLAQDKVLLLALMKMALSPCVP
jgi:hypothetical protein